MNEYTVLTLGEEARAYMRASLENGKTLARLVRELVDLDRGTITTTFRADIDAAKALEFTSGWDMYWDDAYEHMLSLASAVSSTHDTLIWVIEDILAERGDTGLRREEEEGIPLRFLNDEVYYVLSSDTHAMEVIRSAMQSGDADWYALTVLAPLEDPPDLSSPRGEITVDFLRSVVERAPLIAMGVYDGEGILVWQRDTNAVPG